MSELGHDEIVRLYGSWTLREPADAARLFDGFRGQWWIAGGWAIEAFSGVSRPHGDIDPSIPRASLPALREQVAGRYDLWGADGSLHPLVASGTLPDRCENVWARPSGDDPWEYDIILMDTIGDEWIYKRDPRVRRDMSDLTWTRGGIPYLRPEVQLLHKAPGLRPQDEADFGAAAPRLSIEARQWLLEALDTAHPGHPWISVLRS